MLLACFLLLLAKNARGQFQFEIPAEMLQGMMGGGMMGGGGRKGAEWPKTENSEISAEFEPAPQGLKLRFDG
eukprot:g19102.t1